MDRVLIAAVLIALGVVVWIVYNRLTLARLARRAAPDPLLKSVEQGVPVIVYFTTPFCAPCQTQQKPALAALRRDLAVQVIEVDATADQQAAERWGVFSAPTTFVLDGDHTPRHVNRGVATAEMLRAQLESVA